LDDENLEPTTNEETEPVQTQKPVPAPATKPVPASDTLQQLRKDFEAFKSSVKKKVAWL
jgi:hypothetical protein